MMRLFGGLHRRIKAYSLPKLLLMNNVQLDRRQLKSVLAANAVERRWYKGIKRFETLAEILAAAGSKRLVQVGTTANYLPIMRLRNPKLSETYPPYLTALAKRLLDEVGRVWRERMNAAGLSPEIRLAVTSLIRTQTYQNTIVAAGKLADPQSVHTRGEAFDIDASGYYLGTMPINARGSRQSDFKRAFAELGAELSGPNYGDYSQYLPQVHDLLLETLTELASGDKLHFVEEYAGTTNRIFHVCRNPRYEP